MEKQSSPRSMFGSAILVLCLAACESKDLAPITWNPPSLCSLPFDPGTCDALFSVYAFVDGACVERTYGGCEGNENRFFTKEECIATCEGRPEPYDCPEGRVRASICIACGAIGGCGDYADVCAQPCGESTTDCAPPLFDCHDGLCQAGGCI